MLLKSIYKRLSLETSEPHPKVSKLSVCQEINSYSSAYQNRSSYRNRTAEAGLQQTRSKQANNQWLSTGASVPLRYVRPNHNPMLNHALSLWALACEKREGKTNSGLGEARGLQNHLSNSVQAKEEQYNKILKRNNFSPPIISNEGLQDYFEKHAES